MGQFRLTTTSSGSVILDPQNTTSDAVITVPAINGTLAVVQPSSEASAVAWLDANKRLISSSTLKYDGSTLAVIGRVTINGVEVTTENTVFYQNDINVTRNISVTTGKNAVSAGPISIQSGYTVSVPTGSVWTIV